MCTLWTSVFPQCSAIPQFSAFFCDSFLAIPPALVARWVPLTAADQKDGILGSATLKAALKCPDAKHMPWGKLHVKRRFIWSSAWPRGPEAPYIAAFYFSSRNDDVILMVDNIFSFFFNIFIQTQIFLHLFCFTLPLCPWCLGTQTEICGTIRGVSRYSHNCFSK